MNYPKIIAATLVALVQACGTASTKALDNTPISQEAIAGSGSQAQVTPNSSNNPINGSSPQKVNTDQQNAEVEQQSNAPLAVSCAKEEYTSFFEQFVRGKDDQGNEIRYTFTSHYVQVRDYQDPSKLLEMMSRKNDEFSISIRDYTWVQLVPSQVDNSPYTRLKLDFQRVNDKTFRVDYIKAQYGGADEKERLVRTYGEPNAYIFEHRNGCWYLTQKLQSTKRSPNNNAPTSSKAMIESQLTQQMPYGDLRNILLNRGWQPVVTPDCKTNVGGKAEVCDQLPEVEACSGDGYCLMNFANQSDGSKLTVTTYGDYRDWRTTGQESKLRVTRWQ
ncbi:hypothetical protein [Pseudanabaena sp. ABRG5-3]|uniref:hypothetical protein n=1 Tax=Pseudanabaena sp. ABRG5-3 TaxID=685565 RepID=UPI000DC71478|nr:hypothetical protein [Pseudanabaena sp. ABRG5-3]BBC26427.1 hypothetical protein ABRG53_4170 [Pseudanabaena sp. ABRG5-3]